MMVTRVIIIDDQSLMRKGLRTMLGLEQDLRVVGEAASGQEGLAVARETEFDVALVDARMPGLNGVELIRHLSTELPKSRSLVLTTFEDDELLFGAFRAGACGYLLKDAAPEVVIGAIREVNRGAVVLGAKPARRLVEEALRRERVSDWTAKDYESWSRLSERELEISKLISFGLSNCEIAARLCISEGTVKNHVSSTLQKLQLRDRTQLAIAVIDRFGRL